MPRLKKIDGSILIVNDMFRTGKTNQTVIDELKKRPGVKKITSVALFKFVDKKQTDNQIFEDLDFYAYELTRNDIYLPWTTREKTIDETKSKKIKKFREIRRLPLEETVTEMLKCLGSSESYNVNTNTLRKT